MATRNRALQRPLGRGRPGLARSASGAMGRREGSGHLGEDHELRDARTRPRSDQRVGPRHRDRRRSPAYQELGCGCCSSAQAGRESSCDRADRYAAAKSVGGTDLHRPVRRSAPVGSDLAPAGRPSDTRRIGPRRRLPRPRSPRCNAGTDHAASAQERGARPAAGARRKHAVRADDRAAARLSTPKTATSSRASSCDGAAADSCPTSISAC